GVMDYSGRWDGAAFAFASLPEGEFEVIMSGNGKLAGKTVVDGARVTYKLTENAGGMSHRLVVSGGPASVDLTVQETAAQQPVPSATATLHQDRTQVASGTTD